MRGCGHLPSAAVVRLDEAPYAVTATGAPLAATTAARLVEALEALSG